MDKGKATAGGLAGAAAQNLQEMNKLIECPVCFDIPTPPIYMCETGHSICKECRVKLNICGICEKKYTDTRSFALEALIMAAKYKCYNHSKGCKRVGTLEELNVHHLVCPFKQLTCNFLSFHKECNKVQVFIEDYYEHLKTIHNIRILKPNLKANSFTEDFFLDDENHGIARAFWPASALTFDNQIFVAQWSRLNSIINFGFYVIAHHFDGSPKRYGVKIAIRPSGNVDIPHYEMSMQVPSIRATEQDPMEYNVAIPVPFLKQLGKQNEFNGKFYLRWTPEYKLYILR